MGLGFLVTFSMELASDAELSGSDGARAVVIALIIPVGEPLKGFSRSTKGIELQGALPDPHVWQLLARVTSSPMEYEGVRRCSWDDR